MDSEKKLYVTRKDILQPDATSQEGPMICEHFNGYLTEEMAIRAQKQGRDGSTTTLYEVTFKPIATLKTVSKVNVKKLNK